MWREIGSNFVSLRKSVPHVASDTTPDVHGCEPQDAGALEGDEAEAWGIAEAEDALGDTGSDDVSDELELGGGDRGG